MNPTYPLTCPNCAGALYPVVLDPTVAPWVCVICNHAWWVAEILAAPAQWRPATQDFGTGTLLATLQQAVLTERQAAEQRGSSCRVDQLQMIPLPGLLYLSQLKLDPAFMSQVETEIQRKQVGGA